MSRNPFKKISLFNPFNESPVDSTINPFDSVRLLNPFADIKAPSPSRQEQTAKRSTAAAVATAKTSDLSLEAPDRWQGSLVAAPIAAPSLTATS